MTDGPTLGFIYEMLKYSCSIENVLVKKSLKNPVTCSSLRRPHSQNSAAVIYSNVIYFRRGAWFPNCLTVRLMKSSLNEIS